MLKSQRNGRFWCITQPDHGAIAGYLAAHWGNDTFVRPGYFADAPDAERLRAETIFGIAQHDNGWWEWEASPHLSEGDGLALDLFDVLQDQQEGMNRWRRGIPRFARTHPYGSLLTSEHARWLYVPRCGDGMDPAFIHPLYWKGLPALYESEAMTAGRKFLDEVEGFQSELKAMLAGSSDTECWLADEHFQPHARLLQLLDGLSLSLCSGWIKPREGESLGPGRNAFPLKDVPRTGWHDRVELDVQPVGENRIRIDPYPFDIDPLPVTVPYRSFGEAEATSGTFQARWNGSPLQFLRYEYCSPSTV